MVKMTKAEEIYERFVNYEWNSVSESLKDSIIKAINEALVQTAVSSQVDKSNNSQVQTDLNPYSPTANWIKPNH